LFNSKKMINLNVLLIVLSLLYVSHTNIPKPFQSSNDLDELAVSFQNGSSKELSNYFGARVEININGNSGHYSKNQAEQVMRDFFKKQPPKDFQLLNRNNPGNSEITAMIGYYITSEERFKILLKLKSEIDGLSVFALDIIKD
jgi:hypothetical protein